MSDDLEIRASANAGGPIKASNSPTASYLRALRGDQQLKRNSHLQLMFRIQVSPVASHKPIPTHACARVRVRKLSDVPGGSKSNIAGTSDPAPVPTVGGQGRGVMKEKQTFSLVNISVRYA